MALRSFRITFFKATFFEERVLPEQSLYAYAVKRLVALGLLLCASVPVAAQHHNLDDVQAAVASYLQGYYSEVGAVKVEINVNPLDRRLLLAQCEQPLSMRVNDPAYAGGNQTVHTRCEGISPWAVYVPAQVSLFRRLPVAGRNLERGELVAQSDIVMEVVNTNLTRQGQVADMAGVLGKEVRRPISKGEPFRVAALESPLVIKRGDPVVIELQAGSISVNTAGTAMANGRIGDRIRVRNGQSDRIVNAQVLAAGRVMTAI